MKHNHFVFYYDWKYPRYFSKSDQSRRFLHCRRTGIPIKLIQFGKPSPITQFNNCFFDYSNSGMILKLLLRKALRYLLPIFYFISVGNTGTKPRQIPRSSAYFVIVKLFYTVSCNAVVGFFPKNPTNLGKRKIISRLYFPVGRLRIRDFMAVRPF